MDYMESLQNNRSENLSEKGIRDEQLVMILNQFLEKGLLSTSDFDQNTVELLNKLPSAIRFMDDLNTHEQINNFNDYFKETLNKIVSNQQQEQPIEQQTPVARTKMNKPGPDEQKLKEILDRTGYSHEVTVGQRKYGGPPPNWEGNTPPSNGCEVFIGKLPKDCYEDTIVPLFEQYGRLWDLRIMIDSTNGFTKGYAFVTFCDRNDAKRAADQLNGYEIKPNKRIQVNVSIANVRLFIGNIPKTKSKEEIKDEFSKLIEGIREVLVYNPVEEGNDKLKNRGFCFLDFESHKAAAVARRKLQATRIRVFNRDIGVEWADPDEEPDDETMSKVKTLYVKNLSLEITEDELKDKFSAFGHVEQVRRVKDYAFVTYLEREHALKAMETLNGQAYGKNNLEVSLAKPLTDKKKQQHREREERKRMELMMKKVGKTGSSAGSSENGYAPYNHRSSGRSNNNNNNLSDSNYNSNSNNNFDENMFFEMMRHMGFADFEQAMQFFASGGQFNGMNAQNFGQFNKGNNQSYQRNDNNYNATNRGRSSYSNNNYNNRQTNSYNNQNFKRKADNNNVNFNKRGRFNGGGGGGGNQNNNQQQQHDINSQQFPSTNNQQIPQKSLMTDFTQDFY